MRILYLLTRELDGTGLELRNEHAKEHSVEVIDLRCADDYERIVDEMAAADRVISW